MSEHNGVLAIDIGGGTTKLALVDRQGGMRAWQSFSTAAPSGDAFIEKLLSILREIEAQSGPPQEDHPGAASPVLGVSVALAGFVSTEGALEYNANLPWLEHTPIASVVKQALQLPVHIETDSNAACIAEYLYGQGRGSERFLCLTGGTGLGVGMISEGKLLRVAHGCLGDAGHIVVQADGPVCSCGGRGCAEALISTASLGIRYAKLTGRGKASFRSLVNDGELGKPLALTLLEEAGYWTGITAASLASIFFPDRIAIAGGLSHAGDVFFAAAQESFLAHGGRYPLANASLVRASTGEHATLLGAAACFFHPELL